MKKLAIGCLVVFVGVGIAVAGIGYYGYLKVKDTVSQLAELQKVPEIERGIRVQTPFSVPASGELTAAQVDRFMTVATRVRERLGQDLAAFERNYKTLAAKKDFTAADMPALLSAYRDMATGWLNAKRAQVDALNEVGLSLGEYRWIRSEAYRALGVPLVDIDFARIAEQARSGGDPSANMMVGGAFSGRGPAANLKLVERHRKQMEDYLALASFGL
jgi:hypothetical protein